MKMKLSVTLKWHSKHSTLNRKIKSAAKQKRKRDAKRKFCLLLNERSKFGEIPSAILQNTGKKTFRAMWPISVDMKIRKLIKKKFIIFWDIDKKWLKNVDIVVPKQFKRQYVKEWMKLKKKSSTVVTPRETVNKVIAKNGVKSSQNLPLINPKAVKQQKINDNKVLSSEKLNGSNKESATTDNPRFQIKLFNCKICNHKFTSKKLFDEHHHNDAEEISEVPELDSDSDKEMVIDDDVELVLNNSDRQGQDNHIPNLKQEEDLYCCMVNECGRIFENETTLTQHIENDHEKTTFPCNKCNVIFSKEKQFIAHNRLSHNNKPLYPGTKKPENAPKSRSEPHFFTMSPPLSTSDGPSTSTPPNVIKYMTYDKKKSEKFVCSLCSVNFMARCLLDRHMTVHHINKIYFCYKCHGAYSKPHLLSHLKNCHIDCVNEDGYIETIQDMERVASHRCAFCKYTSKERTRVRDHMYSEHYDLFEIDGFKEQENEETSSSPDSLEGIFTQEPQATPPLAEEEEEEDLLVEVEKEDQNIHSKLLAETNKTKATPPSEVKKRRKPNDPSFKYRCARCLRRFSRSNNLRDHLCVGSVEYTKNQKKRSVDPIPKRTSLKSKPMKGFFHCKYCPQVFTNLNLFLSHVSEKHGHHAMTLEEDTIAGQ